MKKRICLMLVALLLVAVMAPTAYATARSESVTVSVTVTGDAFAGLSGILSYDADALTYVSCSSNTGTPMFNANGGYFSWYTSENVSGTVTTISINFTVKDNALCGDAGVSVSNILVGNQDGVAVDANVSVGSVSVDHISGIGVTENDTPSTCSVAGGYDLVFYCTKCNEFIRSEHVAYELAAHTESVVAGYPATCTEPGLTDGIVCSVCGATIKAQEVIPATGHDYKRTNSTPGVDCETNGVDTFTCSRCGDVKTEPNTTKGDHSFTKYVYDESSHWMICDVNSDHVTEKQPHHFVDSGNGKEKCDVCGYERDKSTQPSQDPDLDDEGENKTGDITPYPVYFLIAAMAVMAVSFGFKRKFVK